MKRRDAGFTLLEMLVALVVFSLIMAGIAQTFKFGMAAFRAGPARITEPENLAALDAALTRIIGEALPGSMTGYPDQLSFTTMLPPGAGLNGALADAAILTTPDGRLILRYRQHPPGVLLGTAPPPSIETLLTGVDQFQASYLVSKPSGPPVWTGKSHGGGLPLLVRLHVQLNDGRDWPDLIIAPEAAGN